MMSKLITKDADYAANYTYQRDNTTGYRYEFILKFKTDELRVYKWGCTATSWNPNADFAKHTLPSVGGVFKAPFTVKPPKGS